MKVVMGEGDVVGMATIEPVVKMVEISGKDN